MGNKWYVGIERETLNYVAFKSTLTPTEQSHGEIYAGVIGPFVTKRAAMFTEKYGQGNPHIQHVNDAERLAKRYAK